MKIINLIIAQFCLMGTAVFVFNPTPMQVKSHDLTKYKTRGEDFSIFFHKLQSGLKGGDDKIVMRLINFPFNTDQSIKPIHKSQMPTHFKLIFNNEIRDMIISASVSDVQDVQGKKVLNVGQKLVWFDLHYANNPELSEPVWKIEAVFHHGVASSKSDH